MSHSGQQFLPLPESSGWGTQGATPGLPASALRPPSAEATIRWEAGTQGQSGAPDTEVQPAGESLGGAVLRAGAARTLLRRELSGLSRSI
ncbi:hypothetical protein NDU88_010928 [Pleurodeles waltl]|uniref:Uncharacterized protein n=1 Tax=Pleurodeles waltl TaxID=8319 RepID=A0AAV7RZM4_PLEWA|nr:hypothetical protein NDU88_010928 [Pleurodeles waltl]